jgi:Flp pilus assembly protein TadD
MTCFGRLKTTLLPVAIFLISCQLNMSPLLAKEDDRQVSEAENEAAQGNWRRAVTLLTDVCKGNGENSIAFYDLGVALFHQGKLSEAQTAVDIALKIDPGFVSAYIQLATIKAKAGDYEGAKSSLREALQLEPNNESAKSNLKAIMEMDPKPGTVMPVKVEEAINNRTNSVLPVEENMEIIGGMPALVVRAAQSAEGKVQNSGISPSLVNAPSAPTADVVGKAKEETIKEKAGSQISDNLDQRLKLGFAALSNKNWEGAAYIYGEITKVNESNAQAWLGLGLARFKLNDKESALKAFQKAVALAPHDSAARTAVQFAVEDKVQTGYLPEMNDKTPLKPETKIETTKASSAPLVPGGKIDIGANSDSL